MGMPELEIYSMIGAEAFARLVAAFYRQVPQDDLLGPIYPASDLPGAESRLRDFLIGRFGGPQTYIERRGHLRLRARHSSFPINQTDFATYAGSLFAGFTALPEIPQDDIADQFGLPRGDVSFDIPHGQSIYAALV